MKITPQLILKSVLNIDDPRYIESKLVSYAQQINLNEVEKTLLDNISDQLILGQTPNLKYYLDTFGYYFILDKANIADKFLDKDSIDSAIQELRLGQLKTKLSSDLITVGGKISSMSTKEIRTALKDIQGSVLTEQSYTVPDNGLQRKVDAYIDITTAREGMSLVIPRIEEYAGAASKGTLVSILAAVGGFKSTFALNIAYENAKVGYNVLYLALEDTEKKINNRLTLNHIAVTATKKEEMISGKALRDKKLSHEQIEFYNRKHNELIDLIGKNLIVWDSTSIQYQTFLEMTNTLKLADEQFKKDTGKGLDAIIVDQLALLKFTQGSGRKVSRGGEIMDDWMTYFREQTLNFLDGGRQITGFIVSQIKREAYAEASKPKKKGMYDVSCAGDSNEIERSSATMITLYKDLETANTLLIHIPKAREGEIPDRPIQVEVYGDYYHVGQLNVQGKSISVSDFSQPSFNLGDLIGGKT